MNADTYIAELLKRSKPLTPEQADRIRVLWNGGRK